MCAGGGMGVGLLDNTAEMDRELEETGGLDRCRYREWLSL